MGNIEQGSLSPESKADPEDVIVAATSETNGWLRRHSTVLKTTADAAGITGLIAAQVFAQAKTGSLPMEIGESLTTGTAMMNLMTDGLDRLYHQNEITDKTDQIKLPSGTNPDTIGGSSTPQEKSRGFSRIGARVIHNSGYVMGIPTMAALTGAMAYSRNIPEAIVTGIVDLVIISNLGRRKKILSRLNESETANAIGQRK